MKKVVPFLFAIVAILFISTVTHAQQVDSAVINKRKSQLKNLSPEQRKEIRQALRSKWDSLPSDQKSAMKEAMKTKLQNMTPEEKQALKEKIRSNYKNLSPEEKEMLKQKMKETKNRIDSAIKKN